MRDGRTDSSPTIINASAPRTSLLSILLCLATASFFGFSIVLAKLAFAHGMSPLTFAAFRAFSSVLASLVMVIALGNSLNLPASVRGEVLPITVLFLMVAIGYPTAMKYVPASIAALVLYLFPLIVLAFGSLQEMRFPGIQRISIYVAAFAGLGIVLGPTLDDLRWEGVVAGMIAALGVAIFVLKIPKVTVESNGMALNIYANGLNVVVLLGAAYAFGEFMFPNDFIGWLIMSLSGLFYGIAMVLVFYAVKLAGPITSAVFFNLEPLVVAGLAAVLFSEFLTPVQYAGIVIVIGALMLASLRTGRAHRPTEP